MAMDMGMDTDMDMGIMKKKKGENGSKCKKFFQNESELMQIFN